MYLRILNLYWRYNKRPTVTKCGDGHRRAKDPSHYIHATRRDAKNEGLQESSVGHRKNLGRVRAVFVEPLSKRYIHCPKLLSHFDGLPTFISRGPLRGSRSKARPLHEFFTTVLVLCPSGVKRGHQTRLPTFCAQFGICLVSEHLQPGFALALGQLLLALTPPGLVFPFPVFLPLLLPIRPPLLPGV